MAPPPWDLRLPSGGIDVEPPGRISCHLSVDHWLSVGAEGEAAGEWLSLQPLGSAGRMSTTQQLTEVDLLDEWMTRRSKSSPDRS